MSDLVIQLLERSAGIVPDRPAVIDGHRLMTYGELDARANRLANLLIDLGVRKGDRVGVYMDKALEAVVGLYGAMKAGAAYVPLDPVAPPMRLGYIAADCGIEVLLTGREKEASWSPMRAHGAPVRMMVVLNERQPGIGPDGLGLIGTAALERRPDRRPEVKPTVGDLAYILYTSGSTGEPKGVMLSHRNALTFVEWAVSHLGVEPEDRLSNHAPLHFDLSVFDLFGAALAGAAVSLVPARTSVLPVEVARFIADQNITIWYSVPSLLTMLVLRGGVKEGDLPHLRHVVFAGEVFPTKYLRRLMELLRNAAFHNWYGPTETNVCTAYEVRQPPPDVTEPIPIGKAIDNVDIFALAEDGHRARPGEVGELYVGGSGVMQGYWGDRERTARGLVANPLGGELPGPVYRTGDLVVEQEDGNYRFLGRRDAQIKSRGYRIELGDIESALLAHPGVVEAAVTAVSDEVLSNRLRAHVVLGEGLGRAELVRFCARRLPRYMVPDEFEFTEELPKTSTGKVDRRALAGR